ncbi:ATP-dependent protease [Pseudomonas phage C11]|uniref:ATP-dependent protease n=1 Tax=Pseudomonas phage C11 TaxID=1735586 RepID=UPI0007068CA2|nr:ATP-dependent protease [Pseudomonas phage C11]ALJ97504.1 hypothetical protein C11_044 [Pseudomonas phage C11]
MPVSCTQSVSNRYSILLPYLIKSLEELTEELWTLENAGQNDEVYITINGCGGQVETANAIIRAIKECQAPVHARIEGECASAMTAIALACDSVEIDQFTYFMIHAPSFGVVSADFRNSLRNAAFSSAWCDKWVDHVYSDFLTEKELERVKAGEELYIGGEELEDKLSDFFEKKRLAMEEISE